MAAALVRVRVYDGSRIVQDETVLLQEPSLGSITHVVRLGEKRQKLKMRFDFDPPLLVQQAEDE